MQLYSVDVTLSKGELKSEFSLFFKSQRDAEDYVNECGFEEVTEVYGNYLDEKDLLRDYNSLIEENTQLKLRKQFEAKLEESQEARQGASNVVEPKLWKVTINGSQTVHRTWAQAQNEVQGALSDLNENSHINGSVNISIDEVGLDWLISEFNK